MYRANQSSMGCGRAGTRGTRPIGPKAGRLSWPWSPRSPAPRKPRFQMPHAGRTASGETWGSPQTCRSPATNDGVSEETRTPDTQDHDDEVALQPFLSVDEVFLARVLAKFRLKGCDDPANVVPGAPVASRHEERAVVSWATRQHGFDV